MNDQAMIKQAMAASNDMLDEYAKKQKLEQSGGVEDLIDVPEDNENNDEQLKESSQEINKNLEPQEEVKESDNWRKAREARRKLELENEELRRQLEYQPKVQQQQVAQQQAQQVEDEDLEFDDFMGNEEDDNLATAKHVKKLVEQNKKLVKTVKQMKQTQKIESAETRLRIQYPDYWEMVTPDNLKLLAQKMPGTSEMVRTQQDPYLQHVAAYEAIKQLNVVAKKEDEYLPSKVKVTNNSLKPKSISNMATSSQETPLSVLKSHFGPLSDEEKARWRKIADDAIAGIN